MVRKAGLRRASVVVAIAVSFAGFAGVTHAAPLPLPTPLRNAQTGAVAYTLESFGAKCDGKTNDQPALLKAIQAASNKPKSAVLVPSATCRIVQTAASPTIELTGPVVIRGVSRRATLSLDSDQPGQFRQLFKVSGNDVTIRNLTLTRASDVYGIMVAIGPSTNFSMIKVTLDGRKNVFRHSEFHGLSLNGEPGELIKSARIVGSDIRNTDFGLFQDNKTKVTTEGFAVDRSVFTGNYKDDLEFNAPEATMTNVRVYNSKFSNNLARDDKAPAGFGIGLANVQHAVIFNNTFDGYRYDPVHIEDRSAFVTVRKNTFTNSFTAPLNYASHVFIISGSHDIEVSSNVFDTTANSNRIDAVYVGPGGTSAPPSNVLIKNNTFKLKNNAQPIGNYGATNVQTGANRLLRV